MGFIDLSGSLDRHFGSIGVALNEYVTHLSIATAEQRQISGPSAKRADKCLTLMCEALKVSDQLAITIHSAIPEHVGLGSGTQMSLAIGSALNAYYQLNLTVRDIAALMERGLRSGIGPEASRINNLGWIAGTAWDSGYNAHAVLWVPKLR